MTAANWVRARAAHWRPEEGDAVLYAASALFAGLTARYSGLSLYRQWGRLAVAPYLLAALLSVVVDRIDVRRGTARTVRWHPARLWILGLALVGATLLPLSLEVAWQHAQPEVAVVQTAGHHLAHGKDLYHPVVNRQGKVVEHIRGEPTYEGFFPYLPLMAVFGLPSSTRAPVRLTDARIFFSLVTVAVVGWALLLCRAEDRRKFRALQVLTVLPTAALPLATGGDDMPVVAVLLLAMVLAQRRSPVWAGVALGVASAMKFTAWPLALLALFAARDKNGRRAPVRMAAGVLAVALAVVVPFFLNDPFGFVENVIKFPLGLSPVASPATSPLPGHLLVSAFPVLHHVLPPLVAVVGGVFLAQRLVRHPPATAAQVCRLAGWVMTVAIVFAPATRIGYLLYPINFFVWGYLLRGVGADAALEQQQGAGTPETAPQALGLPADPAPEGLGSDRVDPPAPAALGPVALPASGPRS
jgi:hypothetical protein